MPSNHLFTLSRKSFSWFSRFLFYEKNDEFSIFAKNGDLQVFVKKWKKWDFCRIFKKTQKTGICEFLKNEENAEFCRICKKTGICEFLWINRKNWKKSEFCVLEENQEIYPKHTAIFVLKESFERFFRRIGWNSLTIVFMRL